MLSLGTEVFFAFWMASYSVGLPPGSPPPVRAATSMFLISRANSLPRRASLTAFWCLVVAHLEWALIGVYYLVFGFWCLISRETSLRARPASIVRPLPWRLSIPSCHKQVGGVQFARLIATTGTEVAAQSL